MRSSSGYRKRWWWLFFILRDHSWYSRSPARFCAHSKHGRVSRADARVRVPCMYEEHYCSTVTSVAVCMLRSSESAQLFREPHFKAHMFAPSEVHYVWAHSFKLIEVKIATLFALAGVRSFICGNHIIGHVAPTTSCLVPRLLTNNKKMQRFISSGW